MVLLATAIPAVLAIPTSHTIPTMRTPIAGVVCAYGTYKKWPMVQCGDSQCHDVHCRIRPLARESAPANFVNDRLIDAATHLRIPPIHHENDYVQRINVKVVSYRL